MAQVRPTTGPTAYQDDRWGSGSRRAGGGPQLVAASGRGGSAARATRSGTARSRCGARRSRSAGRRTGSSRCVGRDTNLAAARGPSQLELAYLRAPTTCARWSREGTFPPTAAGRGERTGPRVGDGLIRLDADGMVAYASPNALSAYRRLGLTGDLLGAELAPLTRPLTRDRAGRAATSPAGQAALAGRAPARMEVEARGATVLLRALPLHAGRRRRAARWCWSAT